MPFFFNFLKEKSIDSHFRTRESPKISVITILKFQHSSVTFKYKPEGNRDVNYNVVDKAIFACEELFARFFSFFGFNSAGSEFEKFYIGVLPTMKYEKKHHCFVLCHYPPPVSDS